MSCLLFYLKNELLALRFVLFLWKGTLEQNSNIKHGVLGLMPARMMPEFFYYLKNMALTLREQEDASHFALYIRLSI